MQPLTFEIEPHIKHLVIQLKTSKIRYSREIKEIDDVTKRLKDMIKKGSSPSSQNRSMMS
jgi:hypothetical protein